MTIHLKYIMFSVKKSLKSFLLQNHFAVRTAKRCFELIEHVAAKMKYLETCAVPSFADGEEPTGLPESVLVKPTHSHFSVLFVATNNYVGYANRKAFILPLCFYYQNECTIKECTAIH